MDEKYLLRGLTRSIIGAFYTVYNELGYGYIEAIYMDALERELMDRGHGVAREVAIQIFYRGLPLRWQRLDMVVDGLVVVEAKSGTSVPPGSHRQLYNYLRGSNLEVGLLLHFGPSPKVFREYCAQSGKLRPRCTEPTRLPAQKGSTRECRDETR